jgi:hypothetical protein
MPSHVRGSLFADYVRTIRARTSIDWSRHLAAEDLSFLHQRIQLDAWYPMATFERLGLAILQVVAQGDLEQVRTFGRRTVEHLSALDRALLVVGDPRESLMRFHVLRRTLFDFEAATVARIHDTEVRVQIAYGMSATAEEAACQQTMGFFERLVELAGGLSVASRFDARSWRGDPATMLVVTWKQPAR